ncbi:energy transducer TonB [Burkholderia contaminans]|uniref:energy transducer TonB n=1 Tax=Burkholderia contaminans TaxID=488447 RepID=UPI001F13313F|nr:energy transducer TonB [Burkholderia contaminans]UMY33489.1 TonB C-terminal domain-containing protein [Burkholderia contaminans]
MSTKLTQPVWPPRERGTACAFGLAVALHAFLAAIALSGLRVSQHAPAHPNPVIAVRDLPMPSATPIPRLTQPTRTPRALLSSTGLVAANVQRSVARHHRILTVKTHRLQATASQIAHAIAATRDHSPKSMTVASQAPTVIERDRATRLAALQAISAMPQPESRTMPSPGYAEKVARRVRANVVAPFGIQGNPSVVIAVNCAPSGALLSVAVQRPSGNLQWDRAVLAAVEKSDPMPRDIGGTTPAHIVLTFQPKG